MGARSTDLLLFRDRRYFRIVAEEKRLYYATTGPDGDLVDNGNASGFLNAVASAMSITYHKIMDGEDPTGSTWVDLRLIGEVVYYKRRGALRAAQQKQAQTGTSNTSASSGAGTSTTRKSRKSRKQKGSSEAGALAVVMMVGTDRFNIDLGYRTLKLRCDSEIECRSWVRGLNRWREWAHTDGDRQHDLLPCYHSNSTFRARRSRGGAESKGDRADDDDNDDHGDRDHQLNMTTPLPTPRRTSASSAGSRGSGSIGGDSSGGSGGFRSSWSSRDSSPEGVGARAPLRVLSSLGATFGGGGSAEGGALRDRRVDTDESSDMYNSSESLSLARSTTSTMSGVSGASHGSASDSTCSSFSRFDFGGDDAADVALSRGLYTAFVSGMVTSESPHHASSRQTSGSSSSSYAKDSASRSTFLGRRTGSGPRSGNGGGRGVLSPPSSSSTSAFVSTSLSPVPPSPTIAGVACREAVAAGDNDHCEVFGLPSLLPFSSDAEHTSFERCMRHHAKAFETAKNEDNENAAYSIPPDHERTPSAAGTSDSEFVDACEGLSNKMGEGNIVSVADPVVQRNRSESVV